MALCLNPKPMTLCLRCWAAESLKSRSARPEGRGSVDTAKARRSFVSLTSVHTHSADNLSAPGPGNVKEIIGNK